MIVHFLRLDRIKHTYTVYQSAIKWVKYPIISMTTMSIISKKKIWNLEYWNLVCSSYCKRSNKQL